MKMKYGVGLCLLICILMTSLFGCAPDLGLNEGNQSDELSQDETKKTENGKDDETESKEKENLTVLKPFENIQFIVTGISPYCEVAINNQKCDVLVQEYVTYRFDKTKYRNNDVAVITAELLNLPESEKYTLETSRYEYTISNQPEYITSIDGLILNELEAELDDYVISKTAAALGEWKLFGCICVGNTYSTWKSVDEVTKEEVYLTSIKKNKEFGDIDFYNSLNFTYSIDATKEGGSLDKATKCTIYVNVIVYNIVKNPDGSLQWGKDNPDSYEFKYKTNETSMNNLITSTITIFSEDYNISQVSK